MLQYFELYLNIIGFMDIYSYKSFFKFWGNNPEDNNIKQNVTKIR